MTGKILKGGQNHYNRQYFKKRDHLDMHIAESIRLLANDIKLRPEDDRPLAEKTILDIGCGTGRLVKFFNENGFKAFGCDPNSEALKVARRLNKKGVIRNASATSIPFKKESFDLVTSVSVIEHLSLKEANKFIQEANRVLKNNGFLFMITPNFNSPLRFLLRKRWFGYSDPTHKTFYTPSSLSRLLTKSGFKKIKFWSKTNSGFLVYLLFSTPLALFRDSFWILAQK